MINYYQIWGGIIHRSIRWKQNMSEEMYKKEDSILEINEEGSTEDGGVISKNFI